MQHLHYTNPQRMVFRYLNHLRRCHNIPSRPNPTPTTVQILLLNPSCGRSAFHCDGRAPFSLPSGLSLTQHNLVFLIVFGIAIYVDGIRYLYTSISPPKWGYGCHISLCCILRYRRICDMVHDLSRYIMRFQTGSPQNTGQKKYLREPSTLLRSNIFVWLFVSTLFLACLQSGFVVVLLLSTTWKHHHRRDRASSKQQACPLTTRPAT